MFRFIHSADLHVDSPMRGLERYEGAPVEEIRGATREALRRLVKLAIDEQVAFVLVAGDLYDSDWKDFNTGLFFANEMRRLREAGIRVFLIGGNHDAASQITRSLRMPENVRILSSERPESVVLEDLGVAIHGQSFARPAVTDNLAARYPQTIRNLFNVGLLHTAATGREGHEPYAPCAVEDLLAKRYDYWALGHVHQREILRSDPWIVFPGNTQGRHIHEAGPRGCTLVTVENGRCSAVAEHDLHNVEWALCEVSAAGIGSPEEVLELVPHEVTARRKTARAPLLAARIVIHGVSPAHARLTGSPDRWISELRAAVNDASSGSAWIEKVIFDTRSPLRVEDILRRNDAEGEFMRSLQEVTPDDAVLTGLAGEIRQIKARLPADLFEDPETLDLENPASREALLEKARDTLVSLLLEEEVEA